MNSKYNYPKGGSYNGHWDKSNKRHGIGCLTSSEGAVYNGEFETGIPSGLGVLRFSNDGYYAGQFKMGAFDGLGVLHDSSGFSVEGFFIGGKAYGLGLITFADGSNGIPRYEGFIESNRIRDFQKCPDDIAKSREAEKDALEMEKAVLRRLKNTLDTSSGEDDSPRLSSSEENLVSVDNSLFAIQAKESAEKSRLIAEELKNKVTKTEDIPEPDYF